MFKSLIVVILLGLAASVLAQAQENAGDRDEDELGSFARGMVKFFNVTLTDDAGASFASAVQQSRINSCLDDPECRHSVDIHQVQMTLRMQSEVLEITRKAVDTIRDLNGLATAIKKNLERNFWSTWFCIVAYGPFGSDISFDRYMRYRMGIYEILVFE